MYAHTGIMAVLIMIKRFFNLLSTFWVLYQVFDGAPGGHNDDHYCDEKDDRINDLCEEYGIYFHDNQNLRDFVIDDTLGFTLGLPPSLPECQGPSLPSPVICILYLIHICAISKNLPKSRRMSRK